MKSFFYRHKKWFINLKVKLFSLLSALFLWFFVVTDNYFDHKMGVSLHLVNQPNDWILTRPIPSKVDVLFRGRGKDLLSFAYRDRRIEIDLSEVQTERTFPLDIDMIKGVPQGMDIKPLQIVGIDTITVYLDRYASKKVPISPDITLVPLDGYMQIGDIQLVPDSVVVSGPRSLVNAISHVSTIKETYQNLLKEISSKLQLLPPEWASVEYSLNHVRFKADIQRIGERFMAEIPVEVTNIRNGVKVTVVPSTLSLKLQGGVNILAKLKREEIIATIDYRRRIRYTGRRIPANIQVPEGITFSDVKPPSFELLVER